MTVAIFYNDEETFVVGTNKDGSLMRSTVVLFASEKNIEDYDRQNVDVEDGEVAHIEHRSVSTSSVFKP